MTDENALMMQVKDGQLDSLAVLFENNQVRLFNFFLRMGNSRALSEDFVQETFMRVLAYRTSFTGDSSFRSWIYRIARNAAIDYFRKNKNANKLDELKEEQLSGQGEITELLESEEKQHLFNKALESISSEHREIIILSRFQQLKYEEIADLLECNLNTLKTRMRSAISQLKMSYQQLNCEENR